MTLLNPKDLLLARCLDSGQAARILESYGFKETERADANLQAMADDPRARELLSGIIEELLFCLSQAADPDQALNFLERFTKTAINKIHLFSYLKNSPSTMELLAKTFGGSPFMSEILIRDPHYLYWVSDPDLLYKARKKRDLLQELSMALRSLSTEEKKLDMLRTFKRKEILRIGIRDLLRLSDVEETISSLSILAEVLIQKAYEVSVSSMRQGSGLPAARLPASQGRAGRRARKDFAIIAMGKLGGGELNFSSDVDLVYLYASSKVRSLSDQEAEYFRLLSQKVTRALSDITDEGYLYRVDLRLRPEGKAGSIASSLSRFKNYYASRGETWERLALLKAWPVAGNRSLGIRFLSMTRPFIYGRAFDTGVIAEVRRIKERIDRKLIASGQIHRNVKLGSGGIREIEFIVQSLQASFGRRFPRIEGRNTIRVLRALFRERLISKEEHNALSDAYLFLRDMENKLQMVYDSQTHSLPAKEEELKACAIRLGYHDTDQGSASEQLLEDYQLYTNRVNRIYKALFYADGPSRLSHAALK